jgi:hypothetical protein
MTVGLSLIVVITNLSPISPVYSAMFSVPNIALGSAMACRVFRGIKLGAISDSEGRNATLRSRSHQTNEYSLHFARTTKSIPVAIQMTKTVEHGEPFADTGGQPDQGSPGGRKDAKTDLVFNQV